MPGVLAGLEALMGRGPPSHHPLLTSAPSPHGAGAETTQGSPGAQNETLSLQMPRGPGRQARLSPHPCSAV